MAKIDFRCLTISAGDGRSVLDQEMSARRRRYEIRVKSDATGAERRFEYTDSAHNEARGKVGLSADELLEAFECIVSDAIAGEMEFEEFVDDLGYSDPKIAYKIWKLCQVSAAKVQALFHDAPDLYGMAEELRDIEG